MYLGEYQDICSCPCYMAALLLCIHSPLSLETFSVVAKTQLSMLETAILSVDSMSNLNYVKKGPVTSLRHVFNAENIMSAWSLSVLYKTKLARTLKRITFEFVVSKSKMPVKTTT